MFTPLFRSCLISAWGLPGGSATRLGEHKAKCYDFLVALCQVQYSDIEGIRHQCEVQADSLFEAVAAAAQQFRKSNWGGAPPGHGCEFSVRLLPDAAVQTYTVSLHQVEQFARHGTVKGPKGLIHKNKLREMLGIADA